MIAPPNKGSEIVNYLKHFFPYKWIFGPAGVQLGTDKNSIPLKLGNMEKYEVGIIAGDKSWQPWFSFILPAKDDGMVSLESTKLEGNKSFIVVHCTHMFIMNDRYVLKQVGFFLKNGKFEKKES